MNNPLSALGSTKRFKVDFALVPIAITLMEFAVFLSQLSGVSLQDLDQLIALRVIHTLIMLLIAAFVSGTLLIRGS